MTLGLRTSFSLSVAMLTLPLIWNCNAAYGTVSSRHSVNVLQRLRTWIGRRAYPEGTSLSRFVARDVRRDIVIVSAAQIDEGILTVRARTTNLLYVARGLVPQPDFEPATEVRIDELWKWTGQSWGGLPDGTSLAETLLAKGSEAGQAGEKPG